MRRGQQNRGWVGGESVIDVDMVGLMNHDVRID